MLSIFEAVREIMCEKVRNQYSIIIYPKSYYWSRFRFKYSSIHHSTAMPLYTIMNLLPFPFRDNHSYSSGMYADNTALSTTLSPIFKKVVAYHDFALSRFIYVYNTYIIYPFAWAKTRGLLFILYCCIPSGSLFCRLYIDCCFFF